MKKFTIYLFVILTAAMLLKTGCSDINSGNPSEQREGITSIIPAQAPYGARVVVGGKGFANTKKVLFNGTEAPLEAISDTAILTRVPMNATTGPIEVIAGEQTFSGPPFTVDNSQSLFLSIQNVSPTTIRVQDTVRISGTGFMTAPKKTKSPIAEKRAKPLQEKGRTELQSKKPALNENGNTDELKESVSPKKEFRKVAAEPEVYINNLAATILSVSDTAITAKIPQTAQSGLVSVIVEADTAIGPEINVYKHAITEITPAAGAAGDEVTIKGNNFSERASDNEVAFNGTPAAVVNASSTELLVKVPEGVTSGNVMVSIYGFSVTGPAFTVQSSTLPTISSIQPQSGAVGTLVTISGANFGSEVSDNTVLFAGTEAEIISATSAKIVAEVPEGATDGQVEVQVGSETAKGPNFDVMTTGTLAINIFTSGSSLDPDGYLIAIDNASPERVAINDTLTKSGLEPGSYEVSISDIETNCFTTGDFSNPRTVQVNAGEPTVIEYYINCEGANEPPIAAFTTYCENLTCTFDASGSSDSDGSIESYKWVFGDGNTGTGQSTNYSYEASGSYTVQLTVTDNEGATGTQEQEVTVKQPEITGIFPAFGDVGTEVAIIGTGFSSTKSENTVSFASASGRVDAPVKTASETDLTVDVPNGAVTGPVRATINGYTVEGPEFRVEAYGRLEVIASTGGESLDPNGYQINVQGEGDQNIPANDTLIYDKLKVGSYDVGISDIASNCYLNETIPNPMRVNVTENNTAQASFELYCMNPNQPPVASFTATCTNLTCDFDASGSTDSDGFITSYEWEFGDGSSGTGENVSQSYNGSGTYAVQLTVTDNKGATNTASKNVTVTIPEITNISPTAGPAGATVTITGDHFSPTASENEVTFNGEIATLTNASKTEIQAVVPPMATTGPVAVEVNGYIVTGPIFTVQVPKTLDVEIETTGQELDPDGYILSVEGESDRSVNINEQIRYSNLYKKEVEVKLTGIADNCSIDGNNPRTVNMDNSDHWGNTKFSVTCMPDLTGKILFVSDVDGNQEIYARGESVSSKQNITNTSKIHETDPAISPDGLSIAFISSGMLFVMNSDGSNIRKLTSSDYSRSPSWSPKGDEIVFERSGSSEVSDIFRINIDGSGLQNITNTPNISEQNPDWSSSGNRIVYASDRYYYMNIFTMSPQGTGETQITNNKKGDMEPEWSPDGSEIAFTRTMPDNSRKIYLMDSNGNSQQALTARADEEGRPTWSPDGTKMAYEVYEDGYYHIYIFSLKTGSILDQTYTNGNDRFPHWNN